MEVQTCAGEVMVIVFWDNEGILLWNSCTEVSKSIRSDVFSHESSFFKKRIRMFRLNRKINQIVILPTAPIKHPSTLICFYLLQGALRGHRFADEDDDEIKHNLHEDLRRFSTEFHAADLQRFTQRWKLIYCSFTNNCTLIT